MDSNGFFRILSVPLCLRVRIAFFFWPSFVVDLRTAAERRPYQFICPDLLRAFGRWIRRSARLSRAGRFVGELLADAFTCEVEDQDDPENA